MNPETPIAAAQGDLRFQYFLAELFRASGTALIQGKPVDGYMWRGHLFAKVPKTST